MGIAWGPLCYNYHQNQSCRLALGRLGWLAGAYE